MAQLNGRALTAIGIGSLFIWSGIKGWSVLGTLGDLLTGVPPTPTVVNPLEPLTRAGQSAPLDGEETGRVGTAVGSVASTALQYVGHAYRFGGAPGADGSKPWDCSSFVNYVVGVKLGRAIPGYKAGTYKGTVHGPATGNWAAWSGLTRVSRADVQAGDIIVWVGHMGIATNNTSMVSAQNPKDGTKVGGINGGGNGPIVMMGRLK